MIKFIQCIRRKPGLTKQQFREHWVEYGEQVKAVAAAGHSEFKGPVCAVSHAT